MAARRSDRPEITTSGLNHVLVEGIVRAEPVLRERADGSVTQSFDLSTRLADGSTAVVPVAAPVDARRRVVATGECVIVRGAVTRRFFQVGGRPQSRTEVIAAEIVVRSARRRDQQRLTDLIDEVQQHLESLRSGLPAA